MSVSIGPTRQIPLRIALVSVLLVVPTSGAVAQSVALGIKAGANSTNTGSKTSTQSAHVGAVGGFTITLAMNPVLSVQPEVLWSRKGADGVIVAMGLDTTSAGTPALREDVWGLETSYLEIPILAKLTIPVKGRLVPVIYVGPYVAFELSCSLPVRSKLFDQSGRLVDEEAVDLDCGPNRKGTDAGAVFGGGLDIRLSRITVSVEGRYTHGLVDSGAGGNRAFSVLVGFSASLTK